MVECLRQWIWARHIDKTKGCAFHNKIGVRRKRRYDEACAALTEPEALYHNIVVGVVGISRFSGLIAARTEIKMLFSSSRPLWSVRRVIGFWRWFPVCVVNARYLNYGLSTLLPHVYNTCMLCFSTALLYKPIDRVTRSTLVLHVSKKILWIPLFPPSSKRVCESMYVYNLW